MKLDRLLAQNSSKKRIQRILIGNKMPARNNHAVFKFPQHAPLLIQVWAIAAAGQTCALSACQYSAARSILYI